MSDKIFTTIKGWEPHVEVKFSALRQAQLSILCAVLSGTETSDWYLRHDGLSPKDKARIRRAEAIAKELLNES